MCVFVRGGGGVSCIFALLFAAVYLVKDADHSRRVK